jgi:hypothetical protein
MGKDSESAVNEARQVAFGAVGMEGMAAEAAANQADLAKVGEPEDLPMGVIGDDKSAKAGETENPTIGEIMAARTASLPLIEGRVGKFKGVGTEG